MGKTIKHTNMLKPNPGINQKGYRYFEFLCRGCTIKYRKQIWAGFVSSMDDPINKAIDNSYLTLEEEPSNEYDPNAVMVVCRGEFFGTVGYVGKEFTADVKDILAKCVEYRVDMLNEKYAGEKEIRLLLTWYDGSEQCGSIVEDELINEDDGDSNLEFIWGVQSCDNLTRHCDIYSLNDIELIYHKDTREYTVSIETIYEFNQPDEAVNYLKNLLKAFTEWMQEQGYETEYKPSFYKSFTYTETQHFKTIEGAYMDFKLRVIGFCTLQLTQS